MKNTLLLTIVSISIFGLASCAHKETNAKDAAKDSGAKCTSCGKDCTNCGKTCTKCGKTCTSCGKKEAHEHKDSNAAAAKEITCKQGTESRTLKVVAEGTGCKTLYTVGGAEKTLSNSVKGLDYCNGTVDKVVKNLTASGYKCE